jgi:hypothetical protein
MIEGEQPKRKKVKAVKPADHLSMKPVKAAAIPTSNLDMSQPGISKRPRGRPPLGPKKLTASSSSTSKLSASQTEICQIEANPDALTLNRSGNDSVNSNNHSNISTSTNTQTNGPSGNENTRAARPNYRYVVNKVLTRLMVSDPISATDLSKLLSDCPRDMIHSVLDISQVIGLAIQSKAKEGLRSDYPSGTIVYSLSNYVKGPSAVSIDRIEEDISARCERERKTSKRIIELNVS